MAPISWETYSKLCEFREHLIKIETILSFIKNKSLIKCNDYPEKEYTQVSGSAQHLEQVMI
jgi:hypothetical protein